MVQDIEKLRSLNDLLFEFLSKKYSSSWEPTSELLSTTCHMGTPAT